MERLTQRIDGYLNICGRTALYEAVERPGAYLNNAIVRLAAYEDTGLTPAEIVHADKMLKDNWEMPLERLKEAIDLINAKDDGRLAPVRHGQWLLKHIGAGHMWECSCCHKRPCIYITEDTAYCPNCGAKMDGEVEARRPKSGIT